ncbi:MAG: hypothetical protein ACM3SQ_02490 [Betaproteobacteria bacterium]
MRRALEIGRTILVGTADARNVPTCCRAVALASQDDLATATVYIPLADSQQTLQDVATTRRIAVVASHPVDHCSIQLKGTTTDVRLARDDEAPFVKSRLEGLADVLHHVGVPRRLVRGAPYWPAFAVTMRVEQIFEQTPGPNAGSRLR